MGFSLFNKKQKKSCLWCEFGRKSDYGENIFCLKHGVTGKRDYCRHYKYDVFKRKPDNKNIEKAYSHDDFKI